MPARGRASPCRCCCLASACGASRRGAADVRPRRVRRSPWSCRSSWRGVRARRAMTGDACPARSSRSCGATAVATAATSSTSGWRCCSSAWRRPRRSSTPARRRGSSPARRRRSAATTSRYVKPTVARGRRPPQRPAASRSTSAPCSTSAKNGKHVGTLRPERGYFPPTRPDARARSRASSRARRRARSACAPGLRARRLDRDRARRRATCSRLDRRGRQGLHRAPSDLPAEQRVACSPGARRARRPLRRKPAAGDVPADRLAAGHLDLDRRADRVRRRR